MRIFLRVISAVAFGFTFAAKVRGQAHHIDGPRPNLVETGAPPFAIVGQESLGLNSPPANLRLLPDGRILVTAPQQLALGDGIRWETFTPSPNATAAGVSSVGVDAAGGMYVGTPTGFARIELAENNHWQLKPLDTLPEGERTDRLVPRTQVEAAENWYWHSGSGSVISWKPGQTPRWIARSNDVGHLFSLAGALYLSDGNDGALYRVGAGRMEPVFPSAQTSPNGAVTCAVPFGDREVLVGTPGRGLQLFDGRSMRPFATRTLGRVGRVNDLCQTEGGMFAAAIENEGIVFFDHEGKTVQALTRSVDHRLSGVKQLRPAAGGVIWGLLEHGILRVEFPSSTSYFEPLIGTGVNTAHPNRLDGKLWILADGKIQRGVYDEDGRLDHFETDTPPNLFAFTFSSALGIPLTGTEHGAFYRSDRGWIAFAPEIDNLQILDPTPHDGRWLYAGRGEMGWLSRTATGINVERIEALELSNAYNTISDRDGNIWIEMGLARFGRIRLAHGRPQLETFGAADGIPESWAQAYEIDGVAGFNVAEQILRFDEPTHRFVPDPQFERATGLKNIVGRPGIDSEGQLWVSTFDGIHVLAKEGASWRDLHKKLSPRFRPYYFTFEPHGVVWLHSARRLERYDPAMPVVPPAPLRALITQVSIAGANRTLFPAKGDTPSLAFSENSLVAHFSAPGNSFSAPVSFEVNLEGTGSGWTSTGTSGSAVFNRLTEGHYTLHVRPRSNQMTGAEAVLSFTIRAPWYRTTYAYLAYISGALGLLLSAGWISSYLERRENLRLEKLVAERTRELNASKDRLAHQVEEIRMLSQAIEQSPVAVFITQPDGVIVFANPRASDATGYAASELIRQNLRSLRAKAGGDPASESRLVAAMQSGQPWRGQLVNQHKDGRILHVRTTTAPIQSADGTARHHLVLEEDITEWVADQERRHRLEARLSQAQKLESIGTLAGGIAHDFNNLLTGMLGYCELARLAARGNPEVQTELKEVFSAGLRAKDLVSQILTFSRKGHPQLRPIELLGPVTEALKLIRATTPATVEIRDQLEGGRVRADATQIQQVVLNLCTNATQAMRDRSGILTVKLERVSITENMAAEIPNLSAGSWMRLTVADNGAGMDAATLERIFDPFFTTKRQGEGTGLGLAIVQGIVASHGGALRVQSAPEKGTQFEIYLAVTQETSPLAAALPPVPHGAQQEIMIVDDERSVAAFAATRLQHFGYITTVFTDPRAALDAFVAAPQRFHAIVTDLTMPNLTGLELIKEIRAPGRMIPAVIMTGYGSDLVRASLDALPCCLVVQKPFSGEDLARALHQVIKSVPARYVGN